MANVTLEMNVKLFWLLLKEISKRTTDKCMWVNVCVFEYTQDNIKLGQKIYAEVALKFQELCMGMYVCMCVCVKIRYATEQIYTALIGMFKQATNGQSYTRHYCLNQVIA